MLYSLLKLLPKRNITIGTQHITLHDFITKTYWRYKTVFFHTHFYFLLKSTHFKWFFNFHSQHSTSYEFAIFNTSICLVYQAPYWFTHFIFQEQANQNLSSKPFCSQNMCKIWIYIWIQMRKMHFFNYFWTGNF